MQHTLLTLHSVLIAILIKIVRNRGGKTMSESLYKERTYSTGFPPSVRRTRWSSAKENTQIATSEKRKKKKETKNTEILGIKILLREEK